MDIYPLRIYEPLTPGFMNPYHVQASIVYDNVINLIDVTFT